MSLLFSACSSYRKAFGTHAAQPRFEFLIPLFCTVRGRICFRWSNFLQGTSSVPHHCCDASDLRMTLQPVKLIPRLSCPLWLFLACVSVICEQHQPLKSEGNRKYVFIPFQIKKPLILCLVFRKKTEIFMWLSWCVYKRLSKEPIHSWLNLSLTSYPAKRHELIAPFWLGSVLSAA